MPLAMASASGSVAKRVTVTTGPNTSSRAMRASGGTRSKMVGATK